jgi:Fe-S-cluster containining protein
MVNNPPIYRGILNITKDENEEEIEYYYPSNLKWTCIFCGNCCKDIPGRRRSVKLLKKDIIRLEKIGKKDFYINTNNFPFIGEMKKIEGKCIFLNNYGCAVYSKRALLCRMYPFWVEKENDIFYIYVDASCPGINNGKTLDEKYYRNLLIFALAQMDY